MHDLDQAAKGVQSEEQADLWKKLDAHVGTEVAKADADRIKKLIGRTAGDYLTSRSSSYFQNPAILALGLGDEKGGAVTTARELVKMVQQEETRIGLLQGIADHLHLEVEADDVRRAIFEDDEYDGICCFLNDELWPLVVRLANEDDPNICLDSQPCYRPLLMLLRRCGKDVYIGNAISEINGKAVIRTLLPEMRRKADTARRRGSAVQRRRYPSLKYIEDNLDTVRARIKEVKELKKAQRPMVQWKFMN